MLEIVLGVLHSKISKVFPKWCIGRFISCVKLWLSNMSRNRLCRGEDGEFSDQLTESKFISPIRVWHIMDFVDETRSMCLLISARFFSPNVPTL